MKYLTLKEFEEAQAKTYNSDEAWIQKAKATITEVQKFHGAELLFWINDENRFESVIIKLIHENLDLRISYNDYRKQYSISCEYPYKNVSWNTKKQTIEKCTPPNNIGVLSEKKIKDWVQFYEKVNAILKEENEANKAVIDSFFEKIKNLPIRWDSEKKSGWIEKNGIRFSFSIYEEFIGGQISLLNATSGTIENFIALSDNKYKPPKNLIYSKSKSKLKTIQAL